MRRKWLEATPTRRRLFTDEFKQEAVQMLLDGHSAQSVAACLGLSTTNLLYRWRRQQLERSRPVATSLEARVRELGEQFSEHATGFGYPDRSQLSMTQTADS